MIAYLIVSMGLGHMLPGTPSLPALIYERRNNYIEALRAVDTSLKAQVDAAVDDAPPDCSPIVEFLQPLIEFQMEMGMKSVEMLDRMFAALANRTGRVEVALPPSLIAPTMHAADEFERSRYAAIKRGERVAYLYLHENDEIRRHAPRRHDGFTGVSNEQALKLREAGASWRGNDVDKPR